MALKSTRTAALRPEPRPVHAVLALKPAPGPRLEGLRWQDETATVSVRGDLDRDALWAIDYTLSRAAAEAGRIVLDLREVSHIDYRGVPEIVARRREMLSRGGDLVIAVRNPYVAHILRAVGGSELTLFSSPEEAIGTAQVARAGSRSARRGT